MKVLFVCHRVPYPPKRGGKIRPFNIIRHLSTQGHQVTVASLARTTQELDEASGLAAHCQQVIVELMPRGRAWAGMLRNVLGRQPSSFGYFWSPVLARRIADELARGSYDLIFAHCSSVAPYVANARGPRKILDFGDVDSQKWREYASNRRLPLAAAFWLEAVKLERTERLLSEQFDLCTCTTRAELQSLRDLGVTARSDWFPNGVDTGFFAPGGHEYDPQQLAFVGRMDYYPNQQAVQWFCATVWPELRRRHGELRFLVVGAEPPPSIRALGRLPGVTVTGSVPDVRPYLERAALTVAPLIIARGTQNKILESMAMGTPVVTSRQALGGVDAVPGVHLLVADAADDWVGSIEAVLNDRGWRAQLATAARARVLSHHSWPASMHRLDDMIGKLSDLKEVR
jgi:polysaccharide biosynthesis protein PslH